jgi:chromosome segregation ATPase
MDLQQKVQELEKELALRDDEQDLLERKATLLEQQVLQAAQANHTDSTNDNLVAKLTRKYERMLHKEDRQIEIGKRFEKDNETVRIANAELKALNAMQGRLNIGLQRQLQQVQEQHQQYKEQNMTLQAGASSSHHSWEQDVRQHRQLAYEVQGKLNAVTRERDELYSKLQASHHQREIVWKEVHDQRSQINELLCHSRRALSLTLCTRRRSCKGKRVWSGHWVQEDGRRGVA